MSHPNLSSSKSPNHHPQTTQITRQGKTKPKPKPTHHERRTKPKQTSKFKPSTQLYRNLLSKRHLKLIHALQGQNGNLPPDSSVAMIIFSQIGKLSVYNRHHVQEVTIGDDLLCKHRSLSSTTGKGIWQKDDDRKLKLGINGLLGYRRRRGGRVGGWCARTVQGRVGDGNGKDKMGSLGRGRDGLREKDKDMFDLDSLCAEFKKLRIE